MNTIERSDDYIRVGDAERAAAADRLTEHHAAGRLTLEELEERVKAAWSARTRSDLARLEADLPPVVLSRSGSSPAAPAADRVGLYLHVASYLAVTVMLWLIWLFSGMGHPWPIYPMFGWGIGVIGHVWGAPFCSDGPMHWCGARLSESKTRQIG